MREIILLKATVLWINKLIPDQIDYYIAPIDDGKYYRDRFDFWNNVYGFKMTVMREQHLNEPVFDSLNPSQLLATEMCLHQIDLNKVKKSELDFICKYNCKILYEGELNGFVMWFAVGFSMSHVNISLDGSPHSEKRIFSQLVFFLKNKTIVKKGDTVYGSIALKLDADEKFKADIKLSANLANNKYANIQYYTVE